MREDEDALACAWLLEAIMHWRVRADPIRMMQREAARRLPRAPGVLIPGWFWQEWALVGIVGTVVGAMLLVGVSLLD